MVSIRYGDYIATYDANGWCSSDPGLAEMLNALRVPAEIALAQGDRHLAIAKNAIAQLRAGEVIRTTAGQPALPATV
jgi:hypothetical protein